MTGYQTQFGWNACTKCGGLFYMGRAPVPTCKKDNQPHTPAATNRGVSYLADIKGMNFPDADEANWHFCANCHGLFREVPGFPVNHGVCNHAKPGTTTHEIEVKSSTYILSSRGGPPSAEDSESAYYECTKCGGLFHDWNSTSCNAGGQHVKVSDQRGIKYYLLARGN